MLHASRFIETCDFPIGAVNEASAKEKGGGGRPPYWEMVFWWTRKPLASARAVVAASILPDSVSREKFLEMTRLVGVKGAPHRHSPEIPRELQEVFRQMKLLDPFAGFGSIPLEAIRLGVGEVVAVELLPVAYVFLKAVLEYPKWATDKGFGKRLIEDVKKWGEWVAEQLKQDKDIQELYDDDVAVYIGTWEVRCPICGRYTPLVGNWWLARVKSKRYAYMKPVARNGRVEAAKTFLVHAWGNAIGLTEYTLAFYGFLWGGSIHVYRKSSGEYRAYILYSGHGRDATIYFDLDIKKEGRRTYSVELKNYGIIITYPDNGHVRTLCKE